jgi:hypothetical protein
MSTPIHWKRKLRIFGKHVHEIHRDDALGVQKEVTYSRRWNQAIGTVKVHNLDITYFIDGDETEYKTQGDMLHALRARKKTT